MSATADVQARYDEVVAQCGATGAELSTELAQRQQELDAQLAADRAKLAELGETLSDAHERETPRTPDRRAEDNDVSSRAEDYQELDEDPAPEPPAPPPPPVRQVRAEEDEEELAEFRWDDDPAPARAPARPAGRTPREEEDLSERDWLE